MLNKFPDYQIILLVTVRFSKITLKKINYYLYDTSEIKIVFTFIRLLPVTTEDNGLDIQIPLNVQFYTSNLFIQFYD